MIRRLLLTGILLVSALASASAWQVQKASYTGPGNIITFTAWYSCTRAMSAAVAATGTQKGCDLRRTSDNATCTPLIGTNGSVDLTVGTPCNSSTQTVSAWLNNAASCTGAIVSTTLTIASCASGAVARGLPIFGVNIAANTFITALGTGTGGAGTYTVSISQTAASATITAPAFAAVSKLYDQTAGNACASASCDLVQATAGSQPLFLLSGCAASLLLPCINSNGTTGSLVAAHNFTPAGTNASLTVVGAHQGTTSFVVNQMRMSNQNRIKNATTGWTLDGGTGTVTGAGTDNTFHAVNGAMNGTAASGINVDGTESTNTITAGTIAGPPTIDTTLTSQTQFGEGGFQDGTAWSSGTRTSLCHNQRLYWGTPGSC